MEFLTSIMGVAVAAEERGECCWSEGGKEAAENDCCCGCVVENLDGLLAWRREKSFGALPTDTHAVD